MIVKDLLDKIDFEEMWKYYYNELIKDKDSTPESEEKSKLCHQLSFLKMKKIVPEKSDNCILICYKGIDTLDDDEPPYEYIDVSLFYKDEIKEKFHLYNKFENNYDFSNLSKDEIIQCLHESRNEITSYAFEFSPWKEILGYEICEESLKEIGEIPFFAAIFYEMTFCGFEEEDIQEEKNIIIERKEEVDKAIEEGDTGKFVSLEEVFPDWHKYAPSEESMRKSYLYSLENWKRLYMYIKNI